MRGRTSRYPPGDESMKLFCVGAAVLVAALSTFSDTAPALADPIVPEAPGVAMTAVADAERAGVEDWGALRSEGDWYSGDSRWPDAMAPSSLEEEASNGGNVASADGGTEEMFELISISGADSAIEGEEDLRFSAGSPGAFDRISSPETVLEGVGADRSDRSSRSTRLRFRDKVEASILPEPASLFLFGTGLVGVAILIAAKTRSSFAAH
jgi:PEP-CTERM motif